MTEREFFPRARREAVVILDSLQRTIAALQLKQPDRVPIIEFGIHPVVSDGIARLLWGLDSIDPLDFIDRMDLDGACCTEDYHKQSIDDQHEVDEWGIVRNLSAGQSQGFPVDGPIRTIKDFEKYTPPDPWAPDRWKRLKEIAERFKGKRAVVAWVHDSFLIPAFLRGGEDKLLMDVYDNPRLVHALAEMSADYNVELTKHAIKLGADVIVSGDDYAYKSGPMLSPEHFREFVFPGLRKVVRAAKDNGAFFIKHSDGNVWKLIDMFIEAGADGLNPLEPVAGMDIGEVKKKYGGRVALAGNIDCGPLLTSGTIQEVRDAVSDCLRRGAPGGGYIMSSSNSIHRGVKPENFLEMIRVTKEFGTYPISIV